MELSLFFKYFSKTTISLEDVNISYQNAQEKGTLLKESFMDHTSVREKLASVPPFSIGF